MYGIPLNLSKWLGINLLTYTSILNYHTMYIKIWISLYVQPVRSVWFPALDSIRVEYVNTYVVIVPGLTSFAWNLSEVATRLPLQGPAYLV